MYFKTLLRHHHEIKLSVNIRHRQTHGHHLLSAGVTALYSSAAYWACSDSQVLELLYIASKGRKGKALWCGLLCSLLMCVHSQAYARMYCTSYTSSLCGGWGKTYGHMDRSCSYYKFNGLKFKYASHVHWWQEQQQHYSTTHKLANSKGWKRS